MAVCNYDCFNCIYDDCIVEGVTDKEREEMKERDNEVKAPNKYSKKYREMHKDDIKKYHTEYYYANQRYCQEYSLNYYYANRGSILEALKIRYHSDEEYRKKVNARHREYYRKKKLKEAQAYVPC